MKKIALLCLSLLLSGFNTAFGSPNFENVAVAVMDFGTHKGAATSDINLVNAEKTSCEYVTEKLVDCGKFIVVEKDMVQKTISENNLNTVGLIDPETAKKLGSILNAKYLIYGNVVDVTLSDTGTEVVGNIGGGVTVATVKSHIIARMIDVDTGDIITAAKGEGRSKSTYVKVKSNHIGTVKIGTVKVTQDSVHNAIQKAAYNAIDLMVERLFGTVQPEKKNQRR